MRWDADPLGLVFETSDGSIAAAQALADILDSIRHRKSSETPGSCSKTFRYSWDQLVRSLLLKNPRFPKAIHVQR